MGPKILHIINALSPGGAELHLLTLCREQKRQGLEVTVACLKERAPGVTRTLRHDFEAAGFPVIHLQTDSRYDCRFLYKLPTFLAREKFSLLHSHLPRADLAGAWASFLRPALPWLCSIHDIHSNSWSAKWVLPGFTRVWNRADAIIAISGAVKDWLVREHRVPGAKITVIHYGIETERFSRPGSDLRQALGLDGQPVIGSIGRLEPRKGHDVLIRAMLAVLKEIPEATLLIAGPDMWGYGRNLQQLIDTLGLNGRVRLLGFQEDIPSFLQALDVFAFASKSEGFGQVILEAMAAGKPVVASRVAPLTEIVLDGETGWLAHPEDAGDFSRAVIRLLKLPQEACQLGEQAARRVREQFTTRRMADQTLEIYESLFRKQQ